MSQVEQALSRRAPALRDLRSVRAGLHVVTLVLAVVTVIRTISVGVSPLLATGAGIAFVIVYVATAFPRHAGRAATAGWLLLLTALWVGMLLLSSEYVWLLFPLVLVAGHVLTTGWSILYTLGVTAVGVSAPLWHGIAPVAAQIIGPAIGALFALGMARGYTTLLRDAAERRRLIASLVQAQDEMAALQDELARSQRESGAEGERTRLSRDLHDTIAQDLSSIALVARSGAAQADRPEFEQIETLARGALEDTRRIVHALAPSELEDGAVVDAVRRLADRLAADTGVAVTVTADGAIPALGSAVDVAMLRTVQSALANVRQHAQATRVAITITDMGDSVRWDIADDGAGFDVSAWERNVGTSDSYGLAAMRARLRELGGGLDIESEPGGGSVLSAYVALGARR